MTRLVGPDTSAWVAADPGSTYQSGDAGWFSVGAIPYAATATGTVTSAKCNIQQWASATIAHIYVYEGFGSNNLLGGTHTGSGFTSGQGAGSEISAAINPNVSVTSGQNYIMVWQANNGSSNARPNTHTGTATATMAFKHVAGFPFGSPPSTLPTQDISTGGTEEMWMWLDGTTGGGVQLPLMYVQRKVLYFI